jgi:ABC-type lipoprotein release transport system permease subunit
VKYRQRSRTGRVLLWILLIIVALIVLSVLFGGFQKGTKTSGLGAPPVVAAPAVG